MSSITASSYDIEREEAGETTLELVAVRYTGSQTVWAAEAHLSSAGWPSAAPLDGGPDAESDGSWKFALVPDEALGHLEGRPDIDVVYADQRERFAGLLLEQNRLPGNVFGRGADIDLQNRVFDALGLDSVAKAGPFEEQLRDIAGADEPAPEPEPEKSTVNKLVDTYDREQLKEVCKELREDASEFNLQTNASKTARAEYIAEFDKGERSAAVDAALGGDGE